MSEESKGKKEVVIRSGYEGFHMESPPGVKVVKKWFSEE